MEISGQAAELTRYRYESKKPKSFNMSRYCLAVVAALLSGCASHSPPVATSLQPFSSDTNLEEFQRKQEVWTEAYDSDCNSLWFCDDDNYGDVFEEIVVYAYKRSSEPLHSITNNQEEGVDEGDIVKRVGDHIILLRRGRLFSFALSTELSTLGAIDYFDLAFKAEEDDTWYDEILKYGNRIVLLGYNFDVDSSIVRLFEIGMDGSINEGPSYFFKSSDYYSGNNYGTRLIGSDLIFYTSRKLGTDNQQVVAGEIVSGEFVVSGTLISDETVYRPVQSSNDPIVHTVARCPIGAPIFQCTATSVVGPEVRNFYVSSNAIYLWMDSKAKAFDFLLMNNATIRKAARVMRDAPNPPEEYSVLYRIPFDSGKPGVVEVRGYPANQFSFREHNQLIQVLTYRDIEEQELDLVNLITVPLFQFDTDLYPLEAHQYERLPSSHGFVRTNRFIGDFLLYIDTTESFDELETHVFVKNLNSQIGPERLRINHTVDRIEPVGDLGVLIGDDDSSRLGVTAIRPGISSQLGQTSWLSRASEADRRSHAFNFQRDNAMDVIAFPVTYVPEGEKHEDYRTWDAKSVHMTYLGLTPDLAFQKLGELVSRSSDEEDNCEVSCTDWYGDSRPFFDGGRFYALLGYELIEGYLSGARLFESGRADGLSLLPKREAPSMGWR